MKGFEQVVIGIVLEFIFNVRRANKDIIRLHLIVALGNIILWVLAL